VAVWTSNEYNSVCTFGTQPSMKAAPIYRGGFFVSFRLVTPTVIPAKAGIHANHGYLQTANPEPVEGPVLIRPSPTEHPSHSIRGTTSWYIQA